MQVSGRSQESEGEPALTIRGMDGTTIKTPYSVNTTIRGLRAMVAKKLSSSGSTVYSCNQIALYKANGNGESDGNRLLLNQRVGDIFSSRHGDLFYLPQVFDKKKTRQLRYIDVENKAPDNFTALLEAGADPDILNGEGHTALMLAVSIGDLELITACFDAGADPDILNGVGQTALMLAASKGNLDLITALIDARADPNILGGEGTALMLAAQYGNLDCLRALLEAGADLDTQNYYYDDTALMLAAQYGNLDCLRALLEAGADPDILNGEGDSALTIAHKSENLSCVQAIRLALER